MSRSLVHAVLAIDPGDTTGVFGGYVEERTTRKEMLSTITNRKSIEVSGYWLDQARELANLIHRFRYTANVEQSIPLDQIHVAIEDFQSRPNSGVVRLTSTWVAAGAVALFMIGMNDEDEPVYQQPSDAKNLATNDRLKAWDLWEVGSEHRRDAARHFALRVDSLVV